MLFLPGQPAGRWPWDEHSPITAPVQNLTPGVPGAMAPLLALLASCVSPPNQQMFPKPQLLLRSEQLPRASICPADFPRRRVKVGVGMGTAPAAELAAKPELHLRAGAKSLCSGMCPTCRGSAFNPRTRSPHPNPAHCTSSLTLTHWPSKSVPHHANAPWSNFSYK